jgi:hypothetical protein
VFVEGRLHGPYPAGQGTASSCSRFGSSILTQYVKEVDIDFTVVTDHN